MYQDTRPAPFNAGDHLRYVGKAMRTLPAGRPDRVELVLTAGMVGVVILSTGALSGPGATRPWHVQVQFTNGFQIDVTPENAEDFEASQQRRSLTAGQP